MARPQKVGLDYFPLDVDIDQDDKVAIIEAQHGILGFSIVIKLLMKIYSEGYYYDWTEKEQILFSKRVNVDINQINVVINDCIKWGMFNAKLFEEHEILTSKGIQTRYLEAVKRRNKVEIAKEFLLLSDEIVNSYKNISIVSINVNINEEVEEVNVNINPQSKVKNIKEDNTTTITEDDKNNFSNPGTVAPIDSDSIKQQEDEYIKPKSETVTQVDTDSTKQDDLDESNLLEIQNKYLKLARKFVCNAKDIQNIIKAYKTYKDKNFIISVMEKAFNDNQKRYGSSTINSFNFFTNIFKDEWEKKKIIEDGLNGSNNIIDVDIPHQEIINYLNLKANKNYKSDTSSTKELINARWTDGFRVEDFKKVVDTKVAKWKGNEYEDYLRPETLFSEKFESYLNENINNVSKSDSINKPKNNSFHNFESRTKKYSADELEDKVRKKF